MSFDKVQPNLATYFKLPNRGLLAYLHKTEIGNDEDYRTPLAEGVPVGKVLSQWGKVLKSKKLSDKYPWLMDFENDMLAKCGPLSIQLPLRDRIPKIEEYFTLVDVPSVPINERAIDETVRYFSAISGLNLKATDSTVNDMRLNTNSGAPYFTRRNRVVNETKNIVNTHTFKQFSTLVDNIAILGWRGQEGGPDFEDVKQRIVFMMAFSLNLNELRFYQPAIAAIQKHELIPAYVSKECVNRSVTNLFDTKGKDDLVICTDFSSFDQHFNEDMQAAAKQVWTKLSAPSCSEWIKYIYGLKFSVPLLCSTNLMFRGLHGMGSGSGGTNADESISHKALQFECAIENGARLNKWSLAYGDDGCLSFPGITVDKVVKSYTKHGQDMNVAKQHVSKESAIVLRCIYHTNYRKNGVMVDIYSTYRALNRLCRQERFYDPKKWSKEMVTLRWLSILENCKNHPLFTEFVKFVMNRDKFKLGLKIPGFYSNLRTISSKAMDLSDDFLGYTKSLQGNVITGIEQWEVVKLVKSFAKR